MIKTDEKTSTNKGSNLNSKLLHLISSPRGITLVALIITIIIMLILVGVTINIAINGGLFDIAKNAVKQTEIEAYREKIDAIRIYLLPEQISEGLEGKEYIDRIEEEIRKDSNFEGSTIKRKDEITLTVITKEGYEFEITEEETKYIGKGEGSVEKPEETKPEDLNEANTKFTYTPEGWTSGPVKVKIEVTEEIKGTLEYSLDEENWTKYKTEEEIEISNNTTIYARVINNTGKVGTIAKGNVTKIDKKVPEIVTALSGVGSSSIINSSIEVIDNESGISRVVWYYKLNTESTYKHDTEMLNEENVGVPVVVTKTITNRPAGMYNVYAVVYDIAGNKTISDTINVAVGIDVLYSYGKQNFPFTDEFTNYNSYKEYSYINFESNYIELVCPTDAPKPYVQLTCTQSVDFSNYKNIYIAVNKEIITSRASIINCCPPIVNNDSIILAGLNETERKIDIYNNSGIVVYKINIEDFNENGYFTINGYKGENDGLRIYEIYLEKV